MEEESHTNWGDPKQMRTLDRPCSTKSLGVLDREPNRNIGELQWAGRSRIESKGKDGRETIFGQKCSLVLFEQEGRFWTFVQWLYSFLIIYYF